MAKKIDEKFKAIIRDSASRYRHKLGFLHFEVKILYMDDDLDAEDSSRGGLVRAQFNADRRYLRGTMKIYPNLYESWSKKEFSTEEVKKIIAHEISHMATQHMFDVAVASFKDEGETKDAWESLTTIVGRLLYDSK